MFSNLWGSLSALFDLMEIFTTDSVGSALTVSGGLVMMVFWGYAAYKIVELLVTMRGLGGDDGIVWTLWKQARRPIVTYVLMFVGPIIVSGLAMQAVSHARAGKNVLNTHVGKALGEVDDFWATKLPMMATNVLDSIMMLSVSGSVEGDVEEAMAEFEAASKAVEVASKPKVIDAMIPIAGLKRVHDAKAEAQAAEDRAYRASKTSVNLLRSRIKAQREQLSGVGDMYDPKKLGMTGNKAIAELEAAKNKRIAPLEKSISEAEAQLAKSEATLNKLKAGREGSGDGKSEESESFVPLIAKLDLIWAATKTAFFTFVTGALMIVVYVAVMGLTVAIVKEGFGIMVYVLGFIAMAYAGLALAVPLAPLFMLCFVSDRTESWGRNYINFFLSMLFAAAGLEVMARLAGRTMYALVNIVLNNAVYAAAGAESLWGIMGGILQVAAVIFIGGMGVSLVLGLVKRGTALGTGLFGGSFSY